MLTLREYLSESALVYGELDEPAKQVAKPRDRGTFNVNHINPHPHFAKHYLNVKTLHSLKKDAHEKGDFDTVKQAEHEIKYGTKKMEFWMRHKHFDPALGYQVAKNADSHFSGNKPGNKLIKKGQK